MVIGSFNIGFGAKTNKDEQLIAHIIRSEGFDIIALQEILHIEALQRILFVLGKSYEGAHKSPSLSKQLSQSKAKGYSFIWNKRKAVPMADPKIYEGHSSSDLDRDPFVGRFKMVNLPREIRLINTHIKACIQNPPKAKEYELLAGPIFSRIDRKRYGDFYPNDTILLGDYNLVPHVCVKCHDDPEFIESCEGRSMTFSQYEHTTIKTKQDCYHESLDHFTYDKNRLTDSMLNISRVDAPNDYCEGDFKKYREKVSDHVPIKMEINFRAK